MARNRQWFVWAGGSGLYMGGRVTVGFMGGWQWFVWYGREGWTGLVCASRAVSGWSLSRACVARRTGEVLGLPLVVPLLLVLLVVLLVLV